TGYAVDGPDDKGWGDAQGPSSNSYDGGVGSSSGGGTAVGIGNGDDPANSKGFESNPTGPSGDPSDIPSIEPAEPSGLSPNGPYASDRANGLGPDKAPGQTNAPDNAPKPNDEDVDVTGGVKGAKPSPVQPCTDCKTPLGGMIPNPVKPGFVCEDCAKRNWGIDIKIPADLDKYIGK
ncbi:hypothetical protein, partial [Microvirga brassicacearum]|uniref:hypothetical protein n=1 Tax=Microvirga brassicacearum TaxID=2580413 RepID=UPI001913F01D